MFNEHVASHSSFSSSPIEFPSKAIGREDAIIVHGQHSLIGEKMSNLAELPSSIPIAQHHVLAWDRIEKFLAALPSWNAFCCDPVRNAAALGDELEEIRWVLAPGCGSDLDPKFNNAARELEELVEPVVPFIEESSRQYSALILRSTALDSGDATGTGRYASAVLDPQDNAASMRHFLAVYLCEGLADYFSTAHVKQRIAEGEDHRIAYALSLPVTEAQPDWVYRDAARSDWLDGKLNAPYISGTVKKLGESIRIVFGPGYQFARIQGESSNEGEEIAITCQWPVNKETLAANITDAINEWKEQKWRDDTAMFLDARAMFRHGVLPTDSVDSRFRRGNVLCIPEVFFARPA